jgi:hypothetical protein
LDERSRYRLSAGLENSCYFENGCGHGVNVVKGHEGDRKVCAGVIQWERGGIGNLKIHRRIELQGCGNQGRRRVDTDDGMSELLQVSREPAFAATYVHRSATGRRQQLEKLVTVVLPIGVVSRLPRPLDPLLTVDLPFVGEIHDFSSSGW